MTVFFRTNKMTITDQMKWGAHVLRLPLVPDVRESVLPVLCSIWEMLWSGVSLCRALLAKMFSKRLDCIGMWCFSNSHQGMSSPKYRKQQQVKLLMTPKATVKGCTSGNHWVTPTAEAGVWNLWEKVRRAKCALVWSFAVACASSEHDCCCQGRVGRRCVNQYLYFMCHLPGGC